VDIIQTMGDPQLFEPWFAGGSWDAWRSVLKGAFALPMSQKEATHFHALAQRNPPANPCRELWCVCGRRAGKDSVASLIAAYTAAFFDPKGRLRRGERATVLCLAVDREQAKIVHRYIKAFFTDIRLLARMVKSETANGLELTNGVDVVIATNDFRSIRGRSVALAILDETAFWRDDRSANPDVETYTALLPGMVTIPGSMLIGLSSPHKKSGLLYSRWREHYAVDGDVLVIHAPSIALNPTLDQRVINAELARDPALNRAEWLAEWRTDVSTFLDRALIESAVDNGITVRPRLPNVRYRAFADPSGGSSDSFTLAISHTEKNETVVLDCLVEAPSPFNPDEVTARMAKIMREYGTAECVGDRYGAQWVMQSFAAKGINYRHSHRDRSSIYGDALPLFTAGRVRLLDNSRMVGQFAALERVTTSTRDKIDHPKHAHDDLCNAAAGALVLAADVSDRFVPVSPGVVKIASPTWSPGVGGDRGGGVGYAPHLDSRKSNWPIY
jgi:hypothetical protein